MKLYRALSAFVDRQEIRGEEDKGFIRSPRLDKGLTEEISIKSHHTIFSRPYDLTRHEDTIHNTNRQKVGCEICNDEKTFSRQDTLTGHKKVGGLILW